MSIAPGTWLMWFQVVHPEPKLWVLLVVETCEGGRVQRMAVVTREGCICDTEALQAMGSSPLLSVLALPASFDDFGYAI